MTSDTINKMRRRLLVVATSAVGAVGAGFIAVPFIKGMNPSARAKALGAPVTVDLSQIESGAMLRTKWRGKPVYIVHRTPELISAMPTLDSSLLDPNSDSPQQPDYCKNPLRSRKPEFLISLGVCTHLGCAPNYRPEFAPADLGSNWKGGFFCPCHGSKYDLGSRVYKGVPAPLNMVIPPHYYANDTTVVIGEDSVDGTA